MSEIPNVLGGDTATASWANQVKDRTAMRYASVAARDASLPAPADGELAFLEDSETLTMKVFGGWVTIASGGAAVQERIITPGVILDQESFFVDSPTVDGSPLDTITIPGSTLTGTAMIEVVGVVGGSASGGGPYLFGFNIVGTNVTGNIGDRVTVPANEFQAAWRIAQVPLGAGNNTITVQVNSTIGDGSYRGLIRAWMM